MGIAVSGPVGSTGLVGGERGHASIFLHLGEIESTVETAREVGHIDVEGELGVEKLQHLVFGGAASRHEVCARS